MSNKPTLEVNDEIRSLADKLKKHISKAADAFDGENTFADFLTDKGVSLEEVKKYEDLRPQFLTAAQLAHGEVSIDAFKKDKDLQKTTLSIPALGKDQFVLNMVRSRTGKNPKTGEELTTYGVSSLQVDIHSTGNRGALAKVKEFLKERARAELA